MRIPLQKGLALSAAPALLAWATGCLDDGLSPISDPKSPVTLDLVEVESGFSQPIFVTAPEGDERIFVVELGGLVRIIDGDSVLTTPFLDVSDSVTVGGEQGLLGMAFHPEYAGNGQFFVNYTDTAEDTRVVRYTVSANPDVADQASAALVLTVAQPHSNHNAGMLAFGPDSMLYVGMGDGGSGDDPDNHGQTPSTLLGSMLRLDVDGGPPYAVPPDNPFVDHPTYREETWAYGLRNPWRYSFDRQTGDLYIGDVGQSRIEEVSFQPASSDGGENYGWRVMEGPECHLSSSGCDMTGLTLPVYSYEHGTECSVTGGYVYRGSDYPALTGRYFFGDYCAGWIRSFQVVGGAAESLHDHTDDIGVVPQLTSFGEDGSGELYVMSLQGTVYQVTGVAAEP